MNHYNKVRKNYLHVYTSSVQLENLEAVSALQKDLGFNISELSEIVKMPFDTIGKEIMEEPLNVFRVPIMSRNDVIYIDISKIGPVGEAAIGAIDYFLKEVFIDNPSEEEFDKCAHGKWYFAFKTRIGNSVQMSNDGIVKLYYAMLYAIRSVDLSATDYSIAVCDTHIWIDCKVRDIAESLKLTYTV